jgi:hypothetical protein
LEQLDVALRVVGEESGDEIFEPGLPLLSRR